MPWLFGPAEGGWLFLTGLAFVAVSSWLMVWRIPPAPQPHTAAADDGRGALHGPDLDTSLRIWAPAPSSYSLSLRARSRSLAPSAIDVVVSGGGKTLAQTSVMPLRSKSFEDIDLTERRGGPPLTLGLKRGAYDVALRCRAAGLEVDALYLVDRAGGRRVTFEMELGTTRSGIAGIAKDASGGAWLGTLAEPGGSESVTQRFCAERDGLTGVTVRLVPRGTATGSVRVRLSDLTAGTTTADAFFTQADVLRRDPRFRLRFPPRQGVAGHVFELAFEQTGGVAIDFPVAAGAAASTELLRCNGVPVTARLVFLPEYATPLTRFWPLALLAVPALLLLGFRGPTHARLAMTILVPFVFWLGILYWQRDYQYVSVDEWMPDGYDVIARDVAAVVSEPSSHGWKRLVGFLHQYPHAYNPLTPVLVGLATACTGDLVRSYLGVSLFASFLTAWLLLGLFRRLAPDWRVAWALTCLALTHFLFVRGAVRTSTDPVGYLFVVAALAMALRAPETPKVGFLVALGAVLLLGLLARPTNLPLPFAIGLALLLEPRTKLPWSPRRLVRPLLVAGAPVAFFLVGIWALGFWGSFDLNHRKALEFAEARTFLRFAVCSAVALQALWLPILARRRVEASVKSRQGLVLGAAWTVGFLAFLATSGAPFWNRHFLHVVPGILMMTAGGAAELWRTRPGTAAVWFWSTVLANLALTAANLHLGVGFGDPYLVQ